MSAQVYSVPGHAERRSKAFLEWKSIDLACIISVHQPIPARENKEHPGNFQNKSVGSAFNWVLSVSYDHVQGFHKLEINSFSSSSFYCTFMWGNIWSLIWTFLRKSTNQRCFNCLLAVSFVFTKIYFNITVSVMFWLLTTECKNPSKLKCWQVASFALSTWFCLFLSFFYCSTVTIANFFPLDFPLKPMHIEQIYEFLQEF